MTDNREIVKAARALSRDPAATAHDLRGALKGMLSLYDEINATTFSPEAKATLGDMVEAAARQPVR